LNIRKGVLQVIFFQHLLLFAVTILRWKCTVSPLFAMMTLLDALDLRVWLKLQQEENILTEEHALSKPAVHYRCIDAFSFIKS
jgi:hypothetical protein